VFFPFPLLPFPLSSTQSSPQIKLESVSHGWSCPSRFFFFPFFVNDGALSAGTSGVHRDGPLSPFFSFLLLFFRCENGVHHTGNRGEEKENAPYDNFASSSLSPPLPVIRHDSQRFSTLLRSPPFPFVLLGIVKGAFFPSFSLPLFPPLLLRH